MFEKVRERGGNMLNLCKAILRIDNFKNSEHYGYLSFEKDWREGRNQKILLGRYVYSVKDGRRIDKEHRRLPRRITLKRKELRDLEYNFRRRYQFLGNAESPLEYKLFVSLYSPEVGSVTVWYRIQSYKCYITEAYYGSMPISLEDATACTEVETYSLDAMLKAASSLLEEQLGFSFMQGT